MSFTSTLAITVAAAAVTTVLAVQYILYTKRASEKQEFEQGSASVLTERSAAGEGSYFPGKLAKLIHRASHSTCGGAAQPLLAESRADKTESLQQAAARSTGSGYDATLLMPSVEENTAASVSDAAGDDCHESFKSIVQLNINTETSCRHISSEPFPHPSMESAECSPAGPQNDDQENKSSIVHPECEPPCCKQGICISSMQHILKADLSNTQPDAVLEDTSGNVPPCSQKNTGPLSGKASFTSQPEVTETLDNSSANSQPDATPTDKTLAHKQPGVLEDASDELLSASHPETELLDVSACLNRQPDAVSESTPPTSTSQPDLVLRASQHPECMFPEGTGTLVACPRPSLIALAQHLPSLAEDSEAETESEAVPDDVKDDSTDLKSQHVIGTLSSQPTLLQSNLSGTAADLPEDHSRRSSLDLTPEAAKHESPTTSPSSNIMQPTKAHTNAQEPRIEFAVVLGPSKGVVFTTSDTRSKVHIGRLPQCQLTLDDNEVSGSHCVVVYSVSEHCWKLADVGSLNGTQLNGKLVSKDNRRPGDLHSLSAENVVKLGTATQIKINCFIPQRERSNHDHHRRHLFRNKIDFAPLRLEGCIVTRTGREHKLRATPSEDVVYFEAPFRQFRQAGLFCVFDGHNGRQAAELAKQFIPEEIVSNVNGSTSLLGQGTCQETLEAAFLAADARLSADEGCTATAVVAERAEDGTVMLQIANVGDSAAVLVDAGSDSPAMKLTEDHRVVNPVEKARLQQKGFKGTTRLFGLALSRSMGDKFLKDVDIGLIAKPYVSEMVSIKPEESGVLVVASDGLWDVVTPERATKLVRAAMEEAPGRVDHISERLLMFAVEHQSHDDITVMVLKFNAVTQQPGDQDNIAS